MPNSVVPHELAEALEQIRKVTQNFLKNGHSESRVEKTSIGIEVFESK